MTVQDRSRGPAGRAAPLPTPLADSIERQIRDGAYKTGDNLPSLRELANLHKYAKNTVVTAFELLVSRGLVEPRRGSGYFVVDKPPSKQTSDEAGSLGRDRKSVV